MNPHIGADRRLLGRWLPIVRLAWIALVGLALVVFAAALPVNYQAMRTPLSPETQLPGQLTPEDLQLLQTWGLSPDFHAAFETAQLVTVTLVFTAFGALLFWRKADDPLALFVSFWFAILGVTGTPALDPLIRAYPMWQLPVRFLQGASIGCFPIFTYLFPDGRFVPRWTRTLTIAWIAWIVISPFTPFVVADFAGASLLWFGVLVPGGMGIGILAQLYRYRRVSGPVERQQTKWVVAGFIVMAVGICLFGLAPLIPAVAEPGLARVLYLQFGVTVLTVIPFCLLPLFIGTAILRYRLWNIDHLINRTLVYGTLTGALALAYGSSVVFLQALFQKLTGAGDDLAIIVSTLAIVALFNPLRRRIQDAVDRRFYRRKYDAQQVLTTFTATVRDEVDLDRLSAALLGVVEETMQPTHVSLWLRDLRLQPGDRELAELENHTPARF